MNNRIVTPNVRVRRSAPGLGNGLYADENIPKGRKIIEYTGKELSPFESGKSNSRFLFGLSNGNSIDGSPRSNKARYINHSCQPNCIAKETKGRMFIYAKKPISLGEELTLNYGKEYFDAFIRPKGCRCDPCCLASFIDACS